MPDRLDESASAVQAHLQIMQGVIQRMASNSANCKGWSITLVSAILVVVATTGQPHYAYLALIPVALFALLDMYYLALERGFRRAYNRFIDKLHAGDVAPQDLYVVQPLGSIPRATLAAAASFSTGPFYLILAALVLAARYLILAH